MIKNVDSQHISAVITPSMLPVVADPLLRKHVEAGAILVKVVEESLFMTEETAEEVYQSLSHMLELGARYNQALLVVKLMSRGSARPYDQLVYWIASGGIAIAVDDDEVDTVLKTFDRLLEGKYA